MGTRYFFVIVLLPVLLWADQTPSEAILAYRRALVTHPFEQKNVKALHSLQEQEGIPPSSLRKEKVRVLLRISLFCTLLATFGLLSSALWATVPRKRMLSVIALGCSAILGGGLLYIDYLSPLDAVVMRATPLVTEKERLVLRPGTSVAVLALNAQTAYVVTDENKRGTIDANWLAAIDLHGTFPESTL